MSAQALIDQPFGTVADLVRHHATVQPDHAALVLDAKRCSYRDLDGAMDRVATSLQRLGLVRGDVIGICAASSLAYIQVFLGALRAGVTVAPLPPYALPDSLAGMIVNSGAKVLFLDQDSARALGPVMHRIAAARIALDGSAAGEPLSAWLAAEGSRPRAVTVNPDTIFNIIYSSGTTGTPKGVAQPFGMRWAQAQRARGMFDRDAILILSTPLYSNLTLSPFFQAMSRGITVVIMSKFDPARFLALVQERRVTHTIMVPNQYQRIMTVPEFENYDLSSLKTAYCAAAPFAASLKAEVVRRLPATLVELYGMTEGGGMTMLIPRERPDKIGTIGRPLPGHDLRIIDEDGRELPAGQIGEVVGRSADIMTGYYKQPDATAAAQWFDNEGRRFIRTGDIGRFDEEGFLTLLDRRKDMIISGGFNIYCSDLEAAVLAHPDVAEVAVVGVPSDRWGETPVAFVVPKPSALVSDEELRAFANARLGKMQRLSAVRQVDSLPRNPIGKVLKRDLREQYLKESG